MSAWCVFCCSAHGRNGASYEPRLERACQLPGTWLDSTPGWCHVVPPHRATANRYLLAEVLFQDGKVNTAMTGKDMNQALKNAVRAVHGDYGLGCIMGSLKGTPLLLNS